MNDVSLGWRVTTSSFWNQGRRATASTFATTPEMESIAAGIMFVASDLPVEPAAVPVDVVLEVVVAAVPVGWLVDDCVAAAGAIKVPETL